MLLYYTNTVCFVIDVKASLLLSIIKAPPTPYNTHHIIKLHPPKTKHKGGWKLSKEKSYKNLDERSN